MALQALLPILLSWAVHLSQYDMPEQLPVIEFQSHAFFVEEVCSGTECEVVGWYNDQNVIYIDAKYMHDDSVFAKSLLVHELIHYLQHHSGRFDSDSCGDSLEREREAYQVQNAYVIEAQASFATVWPAPVACRYG